MRKLRKLKNSQKKKLPFDMNKQYKNEILEAVNSGFEHVQLDINGLKDDVFGLKDDMSSIKCEVFVLKDGMSELRGGMKGLHYKIDNLTTSVDGLAKGHRDIDEALVMERAARERLEEKVDGYHK